MAAPSGLKLISPLRVWLIFNALFIALVVSSWVSTYRLAAADNKKLITNQLSTLVKSRFEDLQKSRFRNFVEGTGHDFENLYVQIKTKKESFEFGQLPASHHCSEMKYSLESWNGSNEAIVTMCRPFQFASSSILMVLFAYLIISGLSLAFVLRLERRATATLADFLKDSGVHVDSGGGLIGILGKILDIRIQLDEAKKQEGAMIDAKAKAELAAQVAHDIRSPLAALESITESMGQLPEDHRVIARSAMGRIRDIANHLLVKYRQPSSNADTNDGQKPELAAIAALTDSVLAEKRLQQSTKPVTLNATWAPSSYGCFSRILPAEFKRILSNLINNGMEAIQNEGSVTIQLIPSSEKIAIEIQDTGRGIPEEILARLGQIGETHGKSGGSGLGLYHARTNIAAWDGTFRIDSKQGVGTTVTITLPRAAAPDWFQSELLIHPPSTIVILDDDPSIHHLWRSRFSALSPESKIETLHFSKPDELRAWVKKNPAAATAAIYLLDYELLGFQETGLTLAEELGLSGRATLVTSHFEDSAVLENCARLKVRLIPKNMAGYVPIRIQGEAPPNDKIDAVLIDDDPLVRYTWSAEAQAAGKKLRPFSSAQEFLNKLETVDKNTPIYIDSDLGNGERGEDCALRIYNLGFHEIYLTTGYEPSRFAKLNHLKGVLGKEPPWAPSA